MIQTKHEFLLTIYRYIFRLRQTTPTRSARSWSLSIRATLRSMNALKIWFINKCPIKQNGRWLWKKYRIQTLASKTKMTQIQVFSSFLSQTLASSHRCFPCLSIRNKSSGCPWFNRPSPLQSTCHLPRSTWTLASLPKRQWSLLKLVQSQQGQEFLRLVITTYVSQLPAPQCPSRAQMSFHRHP